MFVETRDEEVFKRFWIDERTNTPQFMQDFGATWICSEADFLEFCQKMWKVYLVNDNTLVYIEPNGEVHLSVLRGADTSSLVSELIKMRGEVLKTLPLLFGWVGRHNRGIRKLMESIGFQFYGFTMFKGESHGKILEWHCYQIGRRELYVAKDYANLI